MHVSRQQEKQAILDGAEARRNGESKNAVPDYEGSLNLRHQWLAGWHDEDMGRL